MGNVLRDQGRFFSIPAEFVESGCLRDMSPSSVRLYVALYYFAQKHSAVRLEFSNAQLQSYAGLDAKSIQSARNQLGDLRLIKSLKGALGVYTYVLLKPTTGEPLPSPEGRTGLRRYHSDPKEQSKRQSEPSTGTKLKHQCAPERRPSQADQARTPVAFRCFACKGTEFWTRGNDRTCARCHPDPRSPVLDRRAFSPPTAKEIGF